MTGRRGGKTAAAREAMERAVREGQHVHYVTYGGSWCLTRQPAGFLYAQLRRPGRFVSKPHHEKALRDLPAHHAQPGLSKSNP